MLQLLLQYIAPGVNTIMLLILIQANAFKQILKTRSKATIFQAWLIYSRLQANRGRD